MFFWDQSFQPQPLLADLVDTLSNHFRLKRLITFRPWSIGINRFGWLDYLSFLFVLLEKLLRLNLLRVLLNIDEPFKLKIVEQVFYRENSTFSTE